jgi:hypothetical protein
VVNRLETLRQGKKTAEELNTKFLQIVDKLAWTEKPHLTIPPYQVLQEDIGTQTESQDSLQRRCPQNDEWMDGESHPI